jgi:hypothetical protein
MKKDVITSVLDTVSTTVKSAEREVNTFTKPARIGTLRKFPILFTLLVTFGVSSVIFGFERILSEIAYLNNHPSVMLIIGVCILIVTGTLYKKL